jgi:hypothetical protein
MFALRSQRRRTGAHTKPDVWVPKKHVLTPTSYIAQQSRRVLSLFTNYFENRKACQKEKCIEHKICGEYCFLKLITAAARSKASNVFARSNTVIVQVLCFWTLSIILSLSKNVMFIFQNTTFRRLDSVSVFR